MDMLFDSIQVGVFVELLVNWLDICQVEYELVVVNLDIDVVWADFYFRLDIIVGFGFQVFNFKFLASLEFVVFNLVGDFMVFLINKKVIQVRYNMVMVKQIQAVYVYE